MVKNWGWDEISGFYRSMLCTVCSFTHQQILALSYISQFYTRYVYVYKYFQVYKVYRYIYIYLHSIEYIYIYIYIFTL